MIKYLKEENIDENLIKQLEAYRKENGLADNARVIKPEYKYYGKKVFEEALAAFWLEKIFSLQEPRLLAKTGLQVTLLIFLKIISIFIKNQIMKI